MVRFGGAIAPQPAQRICPIGKHLGGGNPCASHPSDDDGACASSTCTRNTLCPAAITSPETRRAPVHPMIIHKRAVGAAQVAKLALRRIDLNHEVIAREGHVLRHRTMHEPRPAHDERVVPLKNERAAFERAFEYIQNHTHQFVPSLSRELDVFSLRFPAEPSISCHSRAEDVDIERRRSVHLLNVIRVKPQKRGAHLQNRSVNEEYSTVSQTRRQTEPSTSRFTKARPEKKYTRGQVMCLAEAARTQL